MKNKKIEQHLASALNKAPIPLYDRIKDEPVHKMDEHDFITRQEPVKTQRKHLSVLVPVVSMVAVLAVGLSIWYSQFLAIENAVFIDVNPSIEIAANKQDEVIELNGINQEGRALASQIDYKDKSMQEVTQLILDALLEQKYITADKHTLLVSVLNEDETIGKENAHEVNQWIQDHLRETDIQPVVLQQSVPTSDSIKEAAAQYDISTGKMSFIQGLISLNPDFKEENLVELSIVELIQLAQENNIDLSSIVDIDGEITDSLEENVPPENNDSDTDSSQEESEVPDNSESESEESSESTEPESNDDTSDDVDDVESSEEDSSDDSDSDDSDDDSEDDSDEESDDDDDSDDEQGDQEDEEE